ncbi:MAG: urease accessory protein [Puniceicoccaceae bacterium 5H]|nr:MAG: urease accessory protein [Puniceicoccaceae bacterium 5H]
MKLVRAAIPASETAGVQEWIGLKADRRNLARRRWRALAEDGADIGFDLSQPLNHGDCILIEGTKGYRVEQAPEPVVVLPYASAQEAGRVGWQVGNLHFLAEFAADGMVVEEDLAIMQLVEREGLAFRREERVFCPPVTGMGHHHHDHDEGHHHHHPHKPHGHG